MREERTVMRVCMVGPRSSSWKVWPPAYLSRGGMVKAVKSILACLAIFVILQVYIS